MKANELMIGDWILCERKPYRIVEIGGMVCIDAEMELFAALVDITPIPLTPEILEKNGWEVPEGGLWFRHPKQPFLISMRVSGCYLYSSDEHDKRDFFCCIHYVHELQHALRICGIEKEIVL